MFRIVKGLWFDGYETRCWWKLRKNIFFFWWKTIHWTTFTETVKQWNKDYPKAELTFDKETWK